MDIVQVANTAVATSTPQTMVFKNGDRLNMTPEGGSALLSLVKAMLVSQVVPQSQLHSLMDIFSKSLKDLTDGLKAVERHPKLEGTVKTIWDALIYPKTHTHVPAPEPEAPKAAEVSSKSWWSKWL